jgi:hypothetical protein
MTDRQPTEQPIESDDLEVQAEHAEQVLAGRKAGESQKDFIWVTASEVKTDPPKTK